MNSCWEDKKNLLYSADLSVYNSSNYVTICTTSEDICRNTFYHQQLIFFLSSARDKYLATNFKTE